MVSPFPRMLVVAAPIAVAALVSGCLPSHVEGQFQSHGSGPNAAAPFFPNGQPFAPNDCSNATGNGIDGVLFSSAASPHVRVALLTSTALAPSNLFKDATLVHTPTGLLVSDDQGRQTRFAAAECSAFQAEVHEQSYTVNKVRALEGSLRVACVRRGGPSLEGVVRFSGCSL